MNRWQLAIMWIITFMLTPLILVIIFACALLIILINGYAPFFRQERIGRYGQPFICYKLQTMRPLREGEEYLNPEDNARRSNWLGNFLRNHGLDELPQIFNIFLGEMALFGPRPLMQQNIDLIRAKNNACVGLVDCWLEHRSPFLPGITGWHQVNSSGPDIMLLDLAYVGGLSWSKFWTIVWRSALVIPASKKQLHGHTATSSVFS